MARINKTQFAILGCLTIRSMSAYDIKTFMASSTGFFWQEHEAQLYPTLKRLEEEGAVTSEEAQAAKAGTRKMYQITPEGEVHLKDWLALPAQKAAYRNEFLLKLFFGDQIPVEKSIERLQQYLSELEAELVQFLQIEEGLTAFRAPIRKAFVLATLRYGILITEAEIAWCNESINLLKTQ